MRTLIAHDKQVLELSDWVKSHLGEIRSVTTDQEAHIITAQGSNFLWKRYTQ